MLEIKIFIIFYNYKRTYTRYLYGKSVRNLVRFFCTSWCLLGTYARRICNLSPALFLLPCFSLSSYTVTSINRHNLLGNKMFWKRIPGSTLEVLFPENYSTVPVVTCYPRTSNYYGRENRHRVDFADLFGLPFLLKFPPPFAVDRFYRLRSLLRALAPCSR